MKKIAFFCLAIACFFPLALKAGQFNLSLLTEFIGEAAGDNASPVSSAGDVNGDGYDDFLVGAQKNDANGADAGAAYLIYGDEDLLSDITLSSTTTVKLSGEAADDRAGCYVSSAGDVNGDGYDDILVGAYQNDGGGADAGAAYLIYGDDLPLSDITLSATTTVKFTGEGANDYAGMLVSSAGDVNGDGYDDILIGGYLNDAGGLNAGAAYLIYGQAAALSDITLSAATTVKFTGQANFDFAGYRASSAGDVDNDGYDDIIISAYNNDAGGSQAGAAYLIYGQAAALSDITLSAATTVKFTGEAAGDGAGVSLSSLGHVDNDNYDDFLVGAFRNDDGGVDAGAAYLIYGQSAHLDDASLSTAVEFTGEAVNDYSGASVSSAGDANNDGYNDLMIGAWYNMDGADYVGSAYLIYGQTAKLSDFTLSSDTAIKFIGEEADDRAGASVSSAGDVNNDGYDDLLIGADLNDSGGMDSGIVYLGYLYIDSDQDGFTSLDGIIAGTDCNDSDPAISANVTYYADLDEDGLGDAANTTSICQSTAPTGYVTNDDDLNDNISTTTVPDQSWNEDNTQQIALSSYFTQRLGASMTFAVVTSPEHVTASIMGSTAALTPESNWYGTATVSFSAQDTGAAITSNTINLTVNSVNDAPAKVTSGFSPANNAEVGSAKPTLSWDKSTDPDNTKAELTYHVRLGTNSDPVSNNQYSYTSNTGTASLKVADSLADDVTYYWAVRVSDPESAKSDWSAIKSFSVDTTIAPEITMSKAVIVSSEPFSWLDIFLKPAHADSIANSFFRRTYNWFYPFSFILLFGIFCLMFFISLKFIRNPLHIFSFFFKKPVHSFQTIAITTDEGTYKIPYSLFKRHVHINRLSVFGAAFTIIFLIIALQLSPLSSAADDNGIAIEPNDYLQYTITVKNSGEVAATNAVITDTLPGNTTFQSASDGGSDLVFSTPSLAKNAQWTVSYVVRVNNPCAVSSITSIPATFTSDEISATSSSTLSNPVESGALQLSLKTSAGNPISNAHAHISLNGEKVSEANSNVAGIISFTGLKADTYSVTITGPSYFPFTYTASFALKKNITVSSTITISSEEEEEEEEEIIEEEEIVPTEEIVIPPEDYLTVIVNEKEYKVPTNIKEPTNEKERQKLKDLMELYLKLLFVNDQSVEDLPYFLAQLSTISGMEEYTDENGNVKTIINVSEEELVLKGLTLPNATVTITVKSDPIVQVVQADKFGRWELRIPMELLPPGEHTIYAQSELYGVETNQIVLGKLTVAGEKQKLSNTTWLFIGNLVLIVSIVIFIFFYSQRKNIKFSLAKTRQKR